MYEYFDERNLIALSHHGIKGQKWGVRRFQDYDGHLIGSNRRRNGLVDRVKQLRANRLKKKESKRVAEEKARQASLDDIKKKAITNGDIDTILKMKGQMSTQELQEAAKRLLAIKQIDQYRLPKEKTALDKLVSRLDTGAKTITSVKNFAKSITDLKDQLSGKSSDNKSNQNQNAQQGKKKKNKGSNQDGDQNQNQSKNDSSDSFEKLAKAIAKKLSDVPDNKSQSNQNQNQPKKKGPKKLDVEEELGDSWAFNKLQNRSSEAPKINVANIKRDENVYFRNTLKKNYSEGLSKVGKIFSDSLTSGYQRDTSKSSRYVSKDGVGVRVTESNGRSDLSKGFSSWATSYRNTSIDRVVDRNRTGWTVSNNDDWLSVLSDAGRMHVAEGSNIWEERYSKK